MDTHQKTIWETINAPIFRVTSLRKMAIEAYGLLFFGVAIGFVAGIIWQ